MKKLLLLLILFLCTVPGSTAATSMIIKHLGGCNNLNVLTWWRMENATHGTGDYPADTTNWTLTSATLDASAKKLGTYGALMDGDNHRITILADSGARIKGGAGRLGFWLYVDTDPTTNNREVQIFKYEVTVSQLFQLILDDDGYLTIIWRYSGFDQVNATTANPITADTWMFIELDWRPNVSAGNDVFKLYIDGVEVAGGATYTMTGLGLTGTIWLGTDAAYYGAIFYLDHIIISDSPTKDIYSCKDTESYP